MSNDERQLSKGKTYVLLSEASTVLNDNENRENYHRTCMNVERVLVMTENLPAEPPVR